MKRFPIAKKLGIAVVALACFILAGSYLRAQPAATLDQILSEISSYNGGIDSAPLWKLRDFIYARKDNPSARAECETKLLEFLGTKATPVAKMAVCRHLRLIGSDRSVPVLQRMLMDAETADMALYPLQKIPGAAADKALLQTLPKSQGAIQTAIIAALGERKCAEAIPALLPLLKSNGEQAGAAALALGAIGGEAAANGVLGALPAAPAAVKPLIAAAAMMDAEALAAAKKAGVASGIYERILTDKDLPRPIREAAMIGRISTAGDGAAGLIAAQLKGTDPDMQEAAIVCIREVFKPENIGAIGTLLPALPDSSQIKLIAVLGEYPGDRVRPAILQAARSNTPAVRIASFQALETVGDASSVAFLVETAAAARGAEQTAARGALGLIKGRPVDEALLALLAKKPAEELQVEILMAIAERQLYPAKSAVADCLSSTSPRVRTQALRTLAIVGTPSDVPAVLAFVLKSTDDSELMNGAATVAALARKTANPEGRANAVRDTLRQTKDPKARATLYSILGRIGDDSALPLLRAALADPSGEIVDAAVRALAAWPTSAAKDDVVLLAQKAPDETHRLLALQGFLRMIRSERNRRPEAAVADLRLGYVISSRPEEHRLILGALPNFACSEALELAGILLGDSTVKAEAQTAIDRIKARLATK